MALTQEQLEQYGLTAVEGGSEADGVFDDGSGNFYQIKGFERDQQEGQDNDKGAVFSSSLQKDSGLDVTSFNTINDVKNAVKALSGGNEGPIVKPENVEYSPEIQQAKERVRNWEEAAWSGEQSQDIFGNTNKSIHNGHSTDNGSQQKEAADSLASMYINSIKDDAANRLGTKISV